MNDLAVRVVGTPWGYVGLAASSRGLEGTTLPHPSPEAARAALASPAPGAPVPAGRRAPTSPLAALPTGAVGGAQRAGEEGRPGAGAAAGGEASASLSGAMRFLDGAAAWLEAYCRDGSRTPPAPLDDLAWERVRGFTLRVLRLLPEIPPGETLSYGQVADRLGNPRAARAVGQACAANPWPLLVPCHRVVGARDLGGFGGGLALKEALLAWERKDR